MMDKLDYLARINYAGELKPSLEVLSALQEAHLLSIPFENLDIHNGTKIVLEPVRLFRKIVTMKRGGFCYELNGLFYWLLTELGFQGKLLSGRVFDNNRNDYSPEFDHMLILADIGGGSYLVDVGFGDFSMHPLKFVLNEPIMDKQGQFLFEKDDNEYFKVSRFNPDENQYIPQYIFSAVERRLADFSAMCLYHQTSPDSHFTQKKVCSIAKANGRITLTDDKLIITTDRVRNESPIGNEEEFRRALAQFFNLKQLE